MPSKEYDPLISLIQALDELGKHFKVDEKMDLDDYFYKKTFRLCKKKFVFYPEHLLIGSCKKRYEKQIE